jgi:transcriptional regulator with XRE-family HTH domain
VQTGTTQIKLTPKQVAAMLGVSETTLWWWRRKRCGPTFYRQIKRIYYLKCDIEAWEAGNKVD